VDADLWQEHLSRYELARRWCRGVRVLDAGCGCGYGTAALAETAAEALGLDLSSEAIAYAREHYKGPKLRFAEGDVCATPFPGGRFDVVVAFEVIEHLPDAEAFLKEVRRVLAPGGKLLVSTPNRLYYTEERGYQNPFHAREYDRAEFAGLLGARFAHCLLLEQNHTQAISFTLPGVGSCSAQVAPPPAGDEPHFFVAVCSDRPLDEAAGLVWVPRGGNVLREREQHIRKLESGAAQLEQQTRRELDERRAWAGQLQVELEEKGEAIRALQREFAERAAWAADLERQLQERDETIRLRQRDVERLEGELRERAEWALKLEGDVQERDQRILERQAAVEQMEAELRQRADWGHSLEAELARERARIHTLAEKAEEYEARLRELDQRMASLQTEVDQRTDWAMRLDAQLAERTAWAQQLVAELNAARTELEIIRRSLWYRAGKKARLL
jgi:SAM-dependent methyltransferase